MKSFQKNYLLTLLTLILIVNYADRLVFGIVLQDIKRDLVLSDTQLGFLTGIAFALFYAVMGIPIARWADRGNRVRIISLCTTVWSVAVALCATAAGFFQMMLFRMGVAIGESGCYSTSLSLISDYFPRAERPRAVARYMLGLSLALMIGYFSAGWLNQLYGWRTTFVLFGLPGVVLGVLAWLTLKEPREIQKHALSASEDVSPAPAAASPSVKEVLSTLWVNPAFRNLFLAFTIWGFFANGLLQWQPAFFMRTHGMTSDQVGTWFAVVQGFGSLFGTYLGGEWASRYAARNERLQLTAIALIYASTAIIYVGIYLSSDHVPALLLLGLTSVIGGAGNGPLFATIQTLVPPRMRAMAVSLMYLFTNLIGLGLGPLLVGILSDALQPRFGQDSLRYALLAFAPGFFWCAWHFWCASRTVAHDLLAAQAEDLAMAAEGTETTVQRFEPKKV